MGKSEGNLLTLDELKKRGFDPLDYRYMCLQAHYRTQLNFTWETLQSAHNALGRLRSQIAKFNSDHSSSDPKIFEQAFLEAINDDLNMPKALALLWDFANKVDGRQFYKKLDKVLGLDLFKVESEDYPDSLKGLIEQRQTAKNLKDFAKSDDLRKQIEVLGYVVSDTPEGQKIKKKISI